MGTRADSMGIPSRLDQGARRGLCSGDTPRREPRKTLRLKRKQELGRCACGALKDFLTVTVSCGAHPSGCRPGEDAESTQRGFQSRLDRDPEPTRRRSSAGPVLGATRQGVSPERHGAEAQACAQGDTRGALLRHLRKYGCYLKREGRSHSLWCNPTSGAVEAWRRNSLALSGHRLRTIAINGCRAYSYC